MKESVTVFFFANNNHTQNVRTLQSIYTQDYKCINLIVCNDCSYGFDSERLLNNFQELKPENVQQIYYHENQIPRGEYYSQAQFWDRIDGTFIVTIHSGERFTSPSALRDCAASLKYDASLAAALTGVEEWSDDFGSMLSVSTVAGSPDSRLVLSSENANALQTQNIRDCMVMYRLSALRSLQLSLDKHCVHISRSIIPQLLENGHRIVALRSCMCKFCENSLQNTVSPVPSAFGNTTLRNISVLLQESDGQATLSGDLFQSTLPTPPRKQGNKLMVMLHKLSTFARIKNYAILTLLLCIAGALFLNLNTPATDVLGGVFMVCAVIALLVTAGMLVCNLYFKRNPQRLVTHNGK